MLILFFFLSLTQGETCLPIAAVSSTPRVNRARKSSKSGDEDESTVSPKRVGRPRGRPRKGFEKNKDVRGKTADPVQETRKGGKGKATTRAQEKRREGREKVAEERRRGGKVKTIEAVQVVPASAKKVASVSAKHGEGPSPGEATPEGGASETEQPARVGGVPEPNALGRPGDKVDASEMVTLHYASHPWKELCGDPLPVVSQHMQLAVLNAIQAKPGIKKVSGVVGSGISRFLGAHVGKEV